MTTPLSKDLKNIVTTVTKKQTKWIFNDKRKNCIRRYKYADIHNVSKNDIKEIRNRIVQKYPDYQFVIQNMDKYSSVFSGLIVKVFDCK